MRSRQSWNDLSKQALSISPEWLLAPSGWQCESSASAFSGPGITSARQSAGGRRYCASVIKETPHAMARLMVLQVAGAYRPLIGARFSLTDIAQAHAQADSGHRRGNL